MIRAARLLCVLTLLVALTGWAVPSRAGLPDAQFVRITVDRITSQVTESSPNEVVVRGSVTNFGDRDVSDLDLRIQRAPAVATSAQLRSDMVADNNVYDTLGRFEPVAKVLRPGERTTFTVSIPVRPTPTSTGPTLGIDRPGVYPILLNLNGKPAYGEWRASTTPARCCPCSRCQAAARRKRAPSTGRSRRRPASSPCCGRWPTTPSSRAACRAAATRPCGSWTTRSPGRLPTAAGWTGCCRPTSPPPAVRTRAAPRSAPRSAWPSTPTCWSPSRR
ncbi:hypothetical protein [Tsukamurella sp. PLM1]|uniref:hypothetical protein n=1 Tax=Tsukamurella sp. PLM1 TaxID=2929795 RepID=UPI0020497093|nr:hypothetical protein [Tsukamurella sp. PLM1]BDH59847.1 hypothetical protein MTP03_47860 [Tsukamurella sp. PLM1]